MESIFGFIASGGIVALAYASSHLRQQVTSESNRTHGKIGMLQRP